MAGVAPLVFQNTSVSSLTVVFTVSLLGLIQRPAGLSQHPLQILPALPLQLGVSSQTERKGNEGRRFCASVALLLLAAGYQAASYILLKA